MRIHSEEMQFMDLNDVSVTHLMDRVVIIAHIDAHNTQSKKSKFTQSLQDQWIVYTMLRDADLDVQDIHSYASDVVTKMDEHAYVYDSLSAAAREVADSIEFCVTKF